MEPITEQDLIDLESAHRLATGGDWENLPPAAFSRYTIRSFSILAHRLMPAMIEEIRTLRARLSTSPEAPEAND